MPSDFHNLLHLPLAADVDIGQVIFVVVFLVVAFVQWLIKLIKEKAEAATRSQQMPSEQEAEARRRAWAEQTRQPGPPPMPTTEQHPPSRGTLSDLFGEVRKAIEEASHPKPPPPLPVPASMPEPPAARRQAPSPAPVPVGSASSPLVASDLSGSGSAPMQSLVRKRRAHPLTRLLHTPEGYQQAFILREVLGPPRAFQEYRGPED